MPVYWRETPSLIMEASNAGGVGKNRDSLWIAGYPWMNVAVWTTTATVNRVVYRTERHASVNLCLSQPASTTTTKRREQNRIYLYAVINLKRNLRSTCCTIEAADLTDTMHLTASLWLQGYLLHRRTFFQPTVWTLTGGVILMQVLYCLKFVLHSLL